MTGDALWYEAAQVVGITNALNVVADTLDGLAAIDEGRAFAFRNRHLISLPPGDSTRRSRTSAWLWRWRRVRRTRRNVAQ